MNRQRKPVQIEADVTSKIMPKLLPKQQRPQASSSERNQQQQQHGAAKSVALDRRGKFQMRQRSLPENLHRHPKKLTTIYEDQTDESGSSKAFRANFSMKNDLMTKEEKQAVLMEEARKLERRIERIQKRLEHTSVAGAARIQQHKRRSSYPMTSQASLSSSSASSSSDSTSSSDSSTATTDNVAQESMKMPSGDSKKPAPVIEVASSSSGDSSSSGTHPSKTSSITARRIPRSESYDDLSGKERRNDEMMQGQPYKRSSSLPSDIPQNRWDA